MNLGTLLDQALNEKVTITEQGRSRKISKARASVTQLVNRAAKGEIPALKLLLARERGRGSNLTRGSDADQPGPQPPTAPGPEEQEIPDFGKMSTADLEILMQACWIMDGKRERPPVPMPPEDPGAAPDDPDSRADDPADKERG